MRAVVDTNVLISAGLSPGGNAARVVDAWRADRFTWITSPHLLAELARTFEARKLKGRINWSPRQRAEIVALLATFAEVVEPAVLVDVCRDPDDNRVLEAAVAGSADCIVTGDGDLLALAAYESIPIVTPARFLAVLAAAP
ncbi:MAG: putative toxin-antitoxin system toxin component, PIN family [Chloroflexota bacterium]|nr:putative toxin-antitoxin system toxin component, PIN family [Chloroflexota bacterium]